MDIFSEIIPEVLKKEKRNLLTFLTGAGISLKSGIPTYQGLGKLNSVLINGVGYKPETVGTFKFFQNNPHDTWKYILKRKFFFESVEPNLCHHNLVSIEQKLGDRFFLITQNIDSLHYRAGSKRMFEIHGNDRELRCSHNCKVVSPFSDYINLHDEDIELTTMKIEQLKCKKCGHWMRPNLLWFDESYDERNFKYYSSLKIAKNSGILFVLGTYGSTNLPLELARTTLKNGGYIIDINIEDNYFSKALKSQKRRFQIRENVHNILPKILQSIEENLLTYL